jgi:hypothetical protein
MLEMGVGDTGDEDTLGGWISRNFRIPYSRCEVDTFGLKLIFENTVSRTVPYAASHVLKLSADVKEEDPLVPIQGLS